MVVLLVDEKGLFKTIENELVKADIEYQYAYDLKEYKYERPCLVVDGVPLDMVRASKWVKEHSKV